MKRLRAMLQLVILFALVLTLSADARRGFTWPGEKKAAIILTYDDALASQLHVALPQLDRLNLTATFFLDGRVAEEDMLLWRQAGARGHELGNHTLYHPCSGNTLQRPAQYASENYTVATMVGEVAMMNKLLFGIDGKTVRTYAYPCGETVAGGKDYTDSLRASGLVRYARGVGGKFAFVTAISSVDTYNMPAWGVPEQTGAEELIAFAERTLRQGGIGIYIFHGIGGDYIQVPAGAHEELLQFLAARRDVIWTGTMMEVMDYLTESR